MIALASAAKAAAVMAAVAATALTATPASASTTSKADTGTTMHSAIRPDAGWLGNCHASVSDSWGGGWCDGNGPDWRYQGVVYCSNGHFYLGVVHWAGDRRGSYGYCPTNTFEEYGGLDIYYDSTYQGSDYL